MLAYLSRYTHRVAISNSRLICLDERGVTFRYKDYRRTGTEHYQVMTLDAGEFIRRFLLHVLPNGFHRIRHYGLLASAGRKANILRARALLTVPEPETDCADTDKADPAASTDGRLRCPCCGGRMIVLETFARGPMPVRRLGRKRHELEPLTGLHPCRRRSSSAAGALRAVEVAGLSRTTHNAQIIRSSTTASHPLRASSALATC